VSLSDAEKELIGAAATTADPTRRRQAVAAVLSKSGADTTEARSLLGQSFLAVTRPSFHLVPRGQAMESQADFSAAYDALAAATRNFSDVSQATLTTALLATPSALPALRMIACLTNKELAVAMKLLDPTLRVSDDTLKRFERGQPPDPSVTGRRADRAEARRAELASAIVAAIRATMDRQILTVPENASATFHSKLDHQDTIRGLTSVHDTAVNGVPYSALLYHRYVGGVWRQVQDAYSEAKGDGILELPLAQLLGEEGIPYYRSPSGRSGAAATARRFGLHPGPDFVIPGDQPAVVVESKVAEDGGTARDKASRIKDLADSARRAGLVVCALVDGKGWSERAGALVDVVIATDGRTYSLQTMKQLLDVSEIAGLRGTVPPTDVELLGDEAE
jgi:hypothetical protein